MVAQWCFTGFLWSQWLIQHLANIFVFLPRAVPAAWFLMVVTVMLGLHAVIFYTHGGAIQRVVHHALQAPVDNVLLRNLTAVIHRFHIYQYGPTWHHQFAHHGNREHRREQSVFDRDDHSVIGRVSLDLIQ